MGTIDTLINIANNSIQQTLHVVSDDFNLPSDGILGKDFLRNNNCTINYKNNKFSVFINNEYIHVPLLQGVTPNTCVIPPRCEVFRIFNLQKVNQSLFIDSQELCPGVFTAKCIVDSNNPVIRIINTTADIQTIPSCNIKTEPLSNYIVYSINKTTDSNTHAKELSEILSTKMPKLQKQNLLPLCLQYNDIFALKSDKMTVNNFYEQRLRVEDHTPVYIKNYRLPYTQRAEIANQIDNLLSNDLIEHSSSNYNSPLILVPKKSSDGSKAYRMCVDFRAVNKKLIADKFPLPRVDDILDHLGRAKYFSTIDLFSGFHQIPLHHESRDITSFSSDRGAYRWKVLPFGLNVAPNSFSRMMSMAFSGLQPDQAFLYIDDVIVIGCSEEHHLKNLTFVFDTCRKFNLKLNPYKCNFFRHEVTFLGHKCTASGLLPDHSKILSIDKYPIPSDKDAVRRFVAFANYYRRFIPNFATMAAPLNNLSRKKINFTWDATCQQAFDMLKESLKSPRLLQYPDFTKQFIITVDASKIGCGAILSQLHHNNDLPICFASKSFNKAERNKPVIELELLAIYFAIKQFRPYVYGTEFIVRSDHRPLVHLFNMKDPSSKLVRIRLALSEYKFVIEYLKGKNNVAADALSRISIDDLKKPDAHVYKATTRQMSKRVSNKPGHNNNNNAENNNVFIYDKFGVSFRKKLSRVRSHLLHDDDGKVSGITLNIYSKQKKIFFLNFRVVNETLNLGEMLSRLELEAGNHNIEALEWPKDDEIFKLYKMRMFKEWGNKILEKLNIILIEPIIFITNNEEKLKLLQIYHNDPLSGGHCGTKKLYAKLRSKYYWKHMSREVSNFIRKCDKCTLNKPKNGNRENLVLTETPAKPFDVIIMDTIGPLPMSGIGNKYALTLICDLSKYLVTIAIPDKSAKTIARAVFENFILIYGLMKSLRTDQGTEFKNEVVNELCKLLNIRHNFSTAYHHESVATVERNHRVFNEYLRSYLDETSSDWDTYLKYFTFYHNTTSNTVFDNKFTPYELIFGKNAVLPIETNGSIDPIYNVDNYAREIKFRLQKSHEMAKAAINKHKQKNKRFFDLTAKPLNIIQNDYILIQKQPYDKHKAIYDGPFRVKSVDGVNVTVHNLNGDGFRVVHKNRVRKHN